MSTFTRNATFMVHLSKISNVEVTVDYQTIPNTALEDSDYTPKSGTLTFPSGVVDLPVTVEVRDEIPGASSEQFFLKISNPTSAEISINQATATFAATPISPADDYLIIGQAPNVSSLPYTFKYTLVEAASPTKYISILGAFSPNLVIEPSGELHSVTNIPPIPGTYTVTFQAVSETGVFATLTDTITVGDTPKAIGAPLIGTKDVVYPGYSFPLSLAYDTSSPVSNTALIGTLPTGITWNSSTASLNSGTPTQAGEFPLEIQPVDGNGMWSTHPAILKILYPDVTNTVDTLVATTYTGNISRRALIEDTGSGLKYWRGTSDSNTTPAYSTDGLTFVKDTLASSGSHVYGMDINPSGVLLATGDVSLKRRIGGTWDYVAIGSGAGEVLWVPSIKKFLVNKGGTTTTDVNTRIYTVNEDGTGLTQIFTEAILTQQFLYPVPYYGRVLALPYANDKTKYYSISVTPGAISVTSLTAPSAMGSSTGIAALPDGKVWVCLDTQTATAQILTSNDGGLVFGGTLNINSRLPIGDVSIYNGVTFLAYHPIWDQIILGIYNTNTTISKTFISYDRGLSFVAASVNVAGNTNIVPPGNIRWSDLLGAVYGSKGLGIFFTETGSLEP